MKKFFVLVSLLLSVQSLLFTQSPEVLTNISTEIASLNSNFNNLNVEYYNRENYGHRHYN